MLNDELAREVVFTVIIPFYSKTTKKLKKTLESIYSQQEQSFEIIVVDDNSPCPANDIAHCFDSRLNIIRHPHNKFGGGARNTGVNHANGKYIAFIDADDTWPSDKLSIYKNEMDSGEANQVLYSKVNFTYDENVTHIIKPNLGIRIGQKVCDYLFLNEGLMQTSTICLRTKFARTVFFNENYIRHQDYDYCFRLEQNGAKFKFIELPLSNWIQEKGVDTIDKGATVSFMKYWLNDNSYAFTETAKACYVLKILIPQMLKSGLFLEPIKEAKLNFRLVKVNKLKLLKVYIKAFVKHYINRFF